MQAAVDPFHPLLRLIDRYRADVHELRPPPPADALATAVEAIGQALPPSLRAFLERWNGAVLFRGALRIRAASDLAPAAKHARRVIVFADGPADTDHWAFAPDGQGGTLFGSWRAPLDDNEIGAFVPMHDRFERWLTATLRILDEGIFDEEGRLAARLDTDPDSGSLLLQQADVVLAAGDPDTAAELLHRATATDPGLVPAWERLGDVMRGEDDQQARFAYLKAFRSVRLPAPWPATEATGAALVRTLERLFPAGDDGWERELTWFLEEAVQDALTPAEAAMVEAAAIARVTCHLSRGERIEARDRLTKEVDRLHDLTCKRRPIDATLLAARLNGQLGDGDAAERHLRALRDDAGDTSARASLELGRMAVERSEPWAEMLLDEAIAGLQPPRQGADVRARDRADAWLLLVRRHLERGRQAPARHALGEAAAIAATLKNDSLQQEMALAQGDLMLAEGQTDEAAETWQGLREAAAADPILLSRLQLRRGALSRATGNTGDAAAAYARAAQGFEKGELPLRQAWALVFLAHNGVAEGLSVARSIFKKADLAAGVEATDGAEGRPSLSLDWHLDRAAEHARDRANAQRVRPPLARADADRPERRIGAHRAALASTDVSVVTHLRHQLDQAGRVVGSGGARMSDPTLARYVAAADLLAAHRSFEASEVMLQQLLGVRPTGVAGRALVGAMARSPNAALVNGLLEALENGGIDPSGMALAAEVLGWRREPAAAPVLRRLMSTGNPPTVRKAAIVALGRIGDQEATPALLETLDEPDLSEETSTALLLLGEWQGVDAQAQALAARRPNAPASLGEIVGRYGGPNYLLLLFRGADQEGAASIGAQMGLGYLGDPRAVPRLLESTGARQPTRARAASAALELITGHHEDPEESLLRNRWSEWWESEGGRYQQGLRYRHGRLLDPGGLIDRLGHNDAIVRRSTYDELVISTGHRLAFDAEGPWRIQVAHLRAWRTWWQEQKQRFPAGRWFFHGDVIG